MPWASGLGQVVASTITRDKRGQHYFAHLGVINLFPTPTGDDADTDDCVAGVAGGRACGGGQQVNIRISTL